jgi:glycosyltransferase involved in cell wall biosynthesis
MSRVLVLIPCFNEEAAIGSVVREVRAKLGNVPVVVVDDCSSDSTAAIARQAGARVLPLPHHLGLGGCVQAGYRLAYQLGYDYVVRIDGDGQMDPGDIPTIVEALERSGCQMVIGSRYLNGRPTHTSWLRGLGIRFFRLMLRPILGRAVRDPTSGFVGVNREALAVFSQSFPLEYPEIEALVVLQRRAFAFIEVPCHVRPRLAGRSSITATKSLYYIVHVLLGVLVNILKFERRRWRL